ncbi:unnamed protein product [Urochloa decumbens]|uniref:Uncharacterized protein n=1 Tax=Urochloa decumbens TaxID=240449 RepID=A0ABC8YVH1_9POAL
MHQDFLHLIWISSNLQNLRLEPSLKTYIRNQLLASAAIYLAFFCCLSFLWLSVSSLVDPIRRPWSQIRRSGAYVKASVLIIIAYATLLMVHTRYISLLIMPIILLVFIGALFVIVSPKGSLNLKFDEDNNDEVNKGDKDNMLFLTAVLPSWVLFCLGHFTAGNLVISPFLLFLSSSLGELTLMMARLSSEVAPAFEVMHRSSLVLLLVTAHTMAAELLGDTTVLVCAPEIATALVWLIIQLGHGGYITNRTLQVSLRKAEIAVLGVVAVLTYTAPIIRDDPHWAATDLVSSYMSALVACAFSVILPSLCVFALCQWRRQTAAAPSSELEGAIRLLSFCRDVLFKAATLFLVVKPLVDVPLRLQLQGLIADRWNDVVLQLLGTGTR